MRNDDHDVVCFLWEKLQEQGKGDGSEPIRAPNRREFANRPNCSMTRSIYRKQIRVNCLCRDIRRKHVADGRNGCSVIESWLQRAWFAERGLQLNPSWKKRSCLHEECPLLAVCMRGTIRAVLQLEVTSCRLQEYSGVVAGSEHYANIFAVFISTL